MAWRHRLVLLFLVAALALSSPVSAEKCTGETPWGKFEYDCGAANPSGDGSAETPWWADDRTQAVLAFIGIVGSLSAAGYTYYRVRMRRRTLADFVRAVETTYAQSKAAPAEGVPKLALLRQEVRHRHTKGRIEDAQFFELDKRITGYLTRLRVMEVEHRFPGLPPTYLAELRHLVGDGVVSRADATRLSSHASLWRLPQATRDELNALLETWALEDRGEDDSAGGPMAASPPA